MEEYGIFIFIILIVVLIVTMSASVLKSILPADKTIMVLGSVFTVLLLVNILVIGYSFHVGGWGGLGIGVIASTVFTGIVLGGFLFAIFHYFSERRKKSS